MRPILEEIIGVKMDWIANAEALRARPESRLLEFKREWHDFSAKKSKGEFVRDIVGLANASSKGEVGHMIIGIEDQPGPARIVGVHKRPDTGQLIDLLQRYVQPAPDIEVKTIAVANHEIDVVEVPHSRDHPHYVIKEIDQTLSSAVVYTRKGPGVIRLPPAEHISLLRAKYPDGISSELYSPLVAGFVDIPGATGMNDLVGRVQNVADVRINVWTYWEYTWRLEPRALHRSRSFGGRPLEPGQSAEDKAALRNVHLYVDGVPVERDTIRSNSGWLDVKWVVTHRDATGFLRSQEFHTAIV